MRLRSAGLLLATSLLAILASGSGVRAQPDHYQRYPHLQQNLPPPPPNARRSQTRYDPRQPYRPAPQPVEPRPFFMPFWGPTYREELPPPPQPSAPRYRRRLEERSTPREAVPRPAAPSAPSSTPAVTAAPQKPAVPVTTHVVVFGDSLASHMGAGLEEIFADAPDVGVVTEAKGSSGLVRDDFHDWPKVIEAYLSGSKAITLGVMMVGINDRQPLRENGTSHEPLSERWRTLYGDRVERIVAAFAAKKVPLIWVGVPPLKNERLSPDLIALNEVVRDRVQRGGGVFVDIWPGFVDDDNRYAATGPDVTGQIAKLRSADGIHFTAAGARKAAHFADVEIKRILARAPTAPSVPVLEAGIGKAVDPASQPEAIERLIEASLPELPPVPGIASPAPRPAAGPVLPLTRVEIAPGGVLVAGRPTPDADTRYLTERVLEEGIAAPPRSGRADDFSWPPKN